MIINNNILTSSKILLIAIGLIILYLIYRAIKTLMHHHIWYFLCYLLTIVTIGAGSFWIINDDLVHNTIPKTATLVDGKSENKIENNLVKLTNASNAGPYQNYYYKAGKAKFKNMNNIEIGTVHFSNDSQGRPATASGKLTYEMYQNSKGSRQGQPLNPPNNCWVKYNPKVTIYSNASSRIYHGFLWNRSHSIADSLAGSESYISASNFTAGTRMQNVGYDQKGGMRAAEIAAEEYWYSHPNSNAYIEYQVTPIYHNNERIPRGSIIDEKSSDNVLDQRLVVINDAQGFIINYQNGESQLKN